MADNTTLNLGSGGDLIASDDIGGIKYQRNKLIFGADGTNEGDVSTANPLPIKHSPTTPTDRSATITVGGTAQVLAAANTSRRGWWLKNNSGSSLYVSDITTAVIGNASLEIQAGDLYESPIHGCSPAALSIIGATAGQAFTAREW